MRKKTKCFTLAEVLITIAIIGVVAALGIPSVIKNYQKKQYVARLKKNYGILTNGFRKILANDGALKMSDTILWTKFNANINYQTASDLSKNKFAIKFLALVSILNFFLSFLIF